MQLCGWHTGGKCTSLAIIDYGHDEFWPVFVDLDDCLALRRLKQHGHFFHAIETVVVVDFAQPFNKRMSVFGKLPAAIWIAS